MALCCLLAFWTGGDSARIDDLFRQSGLYRGKWDEVHYADGATYGEKTVSRSIETVSEFYDPDASSSSVSTPSTASADSHQHGAPARTRVYLAEKNRLLIERVTELEATLELKSERIATLEAELNRDKSPDADSSPVTEAPPPEEVSDR
jgi:primase-polymerase (primpol)-like protein